GKNHPVLVALEKTLAVLELTFAVVESAQCFAVSEMNAHDSLLNGMSVGAGISIDSRAEIAGNAGHGFHALQPSRHSGVDHILQDGARFNFQGMAGEVHVCAAKAQNDAIEAGIGDDKIGSAADHDVGNRCESYDFERTCEGAGVRCVYQDSCRAANTKSCELGEGNALVDLEMRDAVQLFPDCGINVHLVRL